MDEDDIVSLQHGSSLQNTLLGKDFIKDYHPNDVMFKKQFLMGDKDFDTTFDPAIVDVYTENQRSTPFIFKFPYANFDKKAWEKYPLEKQFLDNTFDTLDKVFFRILFVTKNDNEESFTSWEISHYLTRVLYEPILSEVYFRTRIGNFAKNRRSLGCSKKKKVHEFLVMKYTEKGRNKCLSQSEGQSSLKVQVFPGSKTVEVNFVNKQNNPQNTSFTYDFIRYDHSNKYYTATGTLLKEEYLKSFQIVN